MFTAGPNKHPAEVVAPADGAFTEAVPFSTVASLHGARAALPSYMLPSVVIGVKEWPRTSSAKIDRKRLPPAATHIRSRSGKHGKGCLQCTPH